MPVRYAATITAAVSGKALYRPWLVVGLLCVVGCLNYLDRIMLTTMRSSVLQDIPMSDARFGLLTSVFLWVYGILSPFAGYLADRFSRSTVIICSLFIWSVVTWATSRAQTFEQLLATRALMGISEACYLPAALALITDYHKGSTRSLATGIHLAGVMTGQSLGFIGGWIAENYHWTQAFSTFGFIGIAYSVVVFFLLKDAPKSRPVEDSPPEGPIRFTDALRKLLSAKAFLYLLFFWGGLGIIGWVIMGWLPTYYKEGFGLSQTEAGLYATGYIYPLSMAGVITGGYLADRFSKKNSMARIIVPAVGLCLAAPAIFLASSSGTLYVAMAGFMLYAFTRVFSDANLMPVLCMICDRRYVATGYGILNLFACLVGGLGIYYSGVLRDARIDFPMLFRIAAFILLFCAGILFIVKREIAKKRPENQL